MSIGGPYNEGCAKDVNGCLIFVGVLVVIAVIGLALLDAHGLL